MLSFGLGVTYLPEKLGTERVGRSLELTRGATILVFGSDRGVLGEQAGKVGVWPGESRRQSRVQEGPCREAEAHWAGGRGPSPHCKLLQPSPVSPLPPVELKEDF